MDGDNAMQSLAQYTDDVLWGAAAQKFPRCKYNLGQPQSIPTGVVTQLLFGGTGSGVVYDTNAMADAANNRILIKTAGWYVVTFWFMWASNATSYRNALLLKTPPGAPTGYVGQVYAAANSGSNTSQQLTTDPIQCAVNDAFTLSAYQGSGAALSIVAGNSVNPFLAVTWWPGQ